MKVKEIIWAGVGDMVVGEIDGIKLFTIVTRTGGDEHANPVGKKYSLTSTLPAFYSFYSDNVEECEKVAQQFLIGFLFKLMDSSW